VDKYMLPGTAMNPIAPAVRHCIDGCVRSRTSIDPD